MWIRFDSPDEFAIKIFAGGVNVISGESMIETPATRLRRLNLLAQNKSIQDYIITPDQLWLDGVAMAEGRVRQFIAMPMGTGYTVEAQITGQDITGGLQFEITPAKVVLPEHSARSLTVKTLPGKNIEFSNLTSWTTIGELKKRIEDKEGIPPDQQRLIHQRIQLDRNSESYILVSFSSLFTQGRAINWRVRDSRRMCLHILYMFRLTSDIARYFTHGLKAPWRGWWSAVATTQ